MRGYGYRRIKLAHANLLYIESTRIFTRATLSLYTADERRYLITNIWQTFPTFLDISILLEFEEIMQCYYFKTKIYRTSLLIGFGKKDPEKLSIQTDAHICQQCTYTYTPVSHAVSFWQRVSSAARQEEKPREPEEE